MPPITVKRRRFPGSPIWVLFLATVLSGCGQALVNFLAFVPEKATESLHAPGDARDVYFDSADGTRLHGLFLPAPDAKRAILYLPGNAGHVYHRLRDARRLRELGAAVLVLGYRGYGHSQGTPSEAGIYRDGAAALGELSRLHPQPLEQTYLYGRSIGSTVAVRLATKQPVAGLILVSPLYSGEAMAGAMGLGLFSKIGEDAFPSDRLISQVQAPCLFIHGGADRIIPTEQGQALYQRCPGSKRLHIVPGAGHNDLVEIAGPDYWRWIGEFINRQVP